MPNENILTFSEAALEAISNSKGAIEVPEGHVLRVGIRGGGCGTMGYILGFDKPQETDTLYQVQGMDIAIDKRHGMYILGMEIDYVDEADRKGFVFINPGMKKEA